MGDTGFCDGLPSGAIINHPGWIVGRIDQQRPRAFGRGLKIGRARLEVMRRIAWDCTIQSASAAERTGVGGIIRVAI